MKKAFIFLSLFIGLLASGCINSLQPLVTTKTILMDDRLEGTWKNKDMEYRVVKFRQSDFYKRNKNQLEPKKKDGENPTEKEIRDSFLMANSYMVEYQAGGIRYEIYGGLIRINGILYINFTPADITQIKEEGLPVEEHLNNRISNYTIARIRFPGRNEVRVDFLDGGFIFDQIRAGHMKIKHEYDPLFENFMITASTAELQQFLEKYGKDERFFNKDNSVTLIRKS